MARLDQDAMARIRRARPDAVVMSDCSVARRDGDPLLRLRRWDSAVPVILVGEADADTDATIDAIKRGATDYLSWPVDTEALVRQVDNAVQHARAGAADEVSIESFESHGQEDAGEKIIGRSAAMQQVCKLIGRVAREHVSVLVLGESGTGKELVARAIHQHSDRSGGPFVAINCAALPEPLLESELFGHEPGAFTGADQRRIGKFQQADGGTLLLDELGDMSPTIQAKFLRILQDGCFQRLGGTQTLYADVRVIAATNQDLQEKIDAGAFRADLYFRLNNFTILLPPLRERIDDLPLLVEHFVNRINRRGGNRALRISDQAFELLRSHQWPGNVRELHSAISYAVVHAVADAITPESLPTSCRDASRDADVLKDSWDELAAIVRRRLDAPGDEVYRELLNRFDGIVVEAALRQVGGNQVAASRRLGISRNTLRAKLRWVAGRENQGEPAQ